MMTGEAKGLTGSRERKSKMKGVIMYKFSAPMPYTIEDINKILEINKHVEKSKITSLYACVPRGCKVFTGFEQSRNFAFEYTDWDYWKRLINHTFDYNCDFIYLLNSPRPLDIENPDFPKQLEKLELLLSELQKIGVKKLRVASAQLMSYIAKHYDNFEILASTSLEYKTIWEYQNFIAFHPKVKQIVPSHDVNKNFLLLKNLRKRYPNVEIELMVNEGCLQGCPNRMFHEYISIDKNVIINDEACLSGEYAISYCNLIVEKYPIHSLVVGTHIFPWDIKEYEKIGINNFKLVGRDGFQHFNNYINAYIMYLQGIDDINNIKNYAIADFVHHLNNPVLKLMLVKDYKKYLPKIEYFKKYGHLCNSRCTIQCEYCYKCVKKIKKILKYNMRKKEKMLHFVQVCKI